MNCIISKTTNTQSFTDKIKASSNKKSDDIEYWRNEHGNPSNKFLQSLANSGRPGAMEKLRSIAKDLDAEFGPGSSAEELIGAIRMATRKNPNTTT